MILGRRQLLQAGGTLAGAAAIGMLASPLRAAATPPAAAAAAGLGLTRKRLSLRSLHTGEHLDLEFARGAGYVTDSLAAIQVLLRDFRNGAQHVIDPRLLDYLHDLAIGMKVDPVFSVISGYRSPQSNELLRGRGDGVARHSLHIEGRAIDVRLAGVGCADLAASARDMGRGGVGYYRQSDFVHLDTGTYRTWNG